VGTRSIERIWPRHAAVSAGTTGAGGRQIEVFDRRHVDQPVAHVRDHVGLGAQHGHEAALEEVALELR
jgi:hypothetical protein